MVKIVDNKREIRSLATEVTSNDRVVEGYALKFNSPSKKLFGEFVEVIDPHAFDGVDMSDVRAFFNHDTTRLLGRTTSGTLELTVDEVGLKFRCELPNTSDGNDVLELVKRGDLNECSFGFSVAEDEWTENPDWSFNRTIYRFASFEEISFVSFPAYNETELNVAQRGLEKAKNELEERKARQRKLELELQLLELGI